MYKQMWVEKYRPMTIAEVVGNEEAKAAFIDWLKKKRKQRAILLYGPPGVGKTALVHAIAHDHGYKIIELNASDVRTRKAILEITGPAVSLPSLDSFYCGGKGTLLLFDEVDGIFGQVDRGGVGAAIEIIKEARIPIVMTANNTDVQRLRPIIEISDSIKFRGIRIPLLVVLLEKICQEEKVTAEREVLEAIAQRSQGDVRSAVNDLQTLCLEKRILRIEDVHRLSTRNRSLDAKQTLRAAFSAVSPRQARSILNNSVIDYDALLLAIHDNLPLRHSNPEDLAAAYDLLSKADVFRGRIGIEVWRLLPYLYDLLAQSVTVNPQTFHPFKPIFPPNKLILLKKTGRKRTILKNICAKIAEKCHVSRRSAKREFLPFIRIMLKDSLEPSSKLATWLELDRESLEYLERMA